MGETNCSNLLLPFNNECQLEEADASTNGLYLVNIRLPEEILIDILSRIDPNDLLKYSLVCRKWNNLIKSYTLWSTIYRRKYKSAAKKLPWYLYYCLLSTNYFNTNLLVNGNGEDGFANWQIKANCEDNWVIEDPPVGADPLPIDVPEFNNMTSCFITRYHNCYKLQVIKLGRSRLFRHILDCYKPHIYVSEWTAGRFDYGCRYRLQCGLTGRASNDPMTKLCIEHRVSQQECRHWKKIELTIKDYPEVEAITFTHEVCDTQGCARHCRSKMAGGVVKLLFESIEPLSVDEHGNEIPKKFSRLHIKTNGTVVEEQNVSQCRDSIVQSYLNFHLNRRNIIRRGNIIGGGSSHLRINHSQHCTIT